MLGAIQLDGIQWTHWGRYHVKLDVYSLNLRALALAGNTAGLIRIIIVHKRLLAWPYEALSMCEIDYQSGLMRLYQCAKEIIRLNSSKTKSF